jgi:uncharacterized UPF0160 family protein
VAAPAKGGTGERENGVRYPSFGLIWARYGADLCGSTKVAARVDQTLVQGIDADDNGQALTTLVKPGVQPMTVSGLIARLNPNWDEDGAGDSDENFAQAVALSKQIIRREIAAVAARHRAPAFVRDVVLSSPDPRLITFDRRVPWEETIISEFPEVLFVIRPSIDGWDLRAVPAGQGRSRTARAFRAPGEDSIAPEASASGDPAPPQAAPPRRHLSWPMTEFQNWPKRSSK